MPMMPEKWLFACLTNTFVICTIVFLLRIETIECVRDKIEKNSYTKCYILLLEKNNWYFLGYNAFYTLNVLHVSKKYHQRTVIIAIGTSLSVLP